MVVLILIVALALICERRAELLGAFVFILIVVVLGILFVPGVDEMVENVVVQATAIAKEVL